MTGLLRALTAGAAVVLLGCGARGEPEIALPPVDAKALELTDSLVLTAPGGVTVWLTEGRAGTGAGGITCVERTIEVRRDSVKRKVPLLYTRSAPVLENDSTMLAELSKDCQLFARYRIGLGDAMPHKISP